MELNSLNNPNGQSANIREKEKPVGAEEARADKPLGYKQHMDGDFHLIGETLADPTVIMPVGIQSLGTSPFVAREDHSHSLGGLLQFGADDSLSFNDAANQYVWTHDATTSLIIGKSATYFPDGTNLAPGITFIADLGTGIYRAAAGRIGIPNTGNNMPITIGSWTSGATYSAIGGANGYLIFAHPTDTATYLRGNAVLNLGGYGADGIQCNNGNVRFLQNVYANGFVNAADYVHGNSGLSTNGSLSVAGNVSCGQITATNLNMTAGNLYCPGYIQSGNNTQGPLTWGTWGHSASSWDQNAIRAGSGATQGCVSMWASGIAPQLRVGTAAQQIYVRAAGGENIITHDCAAHYSSSSIRYKQDVVDWPMDKAMALSSDVHEEVADPISIIKKVRPVFYRRKREQWLSQIPTSPRRALAHAKLNRVRESMGQAPFESDELIHDCARDNCKGDADNPCTRVKDWETGSIGFIAEELVEVVPQMVGYDHETGLLESVDLMQIASLAVAACKSQQTMIDDLLQKVERLESLVGSQ